MKVFRLSPVVLGCGIIICTRVSSFGAPPGKPTFGFSFLEANGIDQHDAAAYSQVLRAAIDNAGVYKCLEFSDMSMLLAEQGLSDRCTDAHCAVVAGQIVDADYFGFGTIGSVGEAFIISMQVVEVRTGRIVSDISEFHKGKKAALNNKTIHRFARKLSGLEKKRNGRKR
ncbi:MAG: hypothetical protein JXA18_16355 [Chitinispirillaceae bacterium]|nr:hypothetical protein [Chitinispirillaceae bacterium]